MFNFLFQTRVLSCEILINVPGIKTSNDWMSHLKSLAGRPVQTINTLLLFILRCFFVINTRMMLKLIKCRFGSTRLTPPCYPHHYKITHSCIQIHFKCCLFKDTLCLENKLISNGQNNILYRFFF